MIDSEAVADEWYRAAGAVLPLRPRVKSLHRPAHREQIIRRLRTLTPDSERRWGRMTVRQMVCHLTDAFRNLLGERTVTSVVAPPTLAGRTLVRFIALSAPVRWPHGIRTRAEADQEQGGTPPSVDFSADVAALEAAVGRFLAAGKHAPRKPHYMFGALTEAEWGRWAYRHMDHHLRQFGV